MLLDNVIASAIAVGCAVSVGILSIVIAYILHWMVRIFLWMAQTVFLFFFPHKPIERFGETWYPVWESWKREIVGMIPEFTLSYEGDDKQKWIDDFELKKQKYQQFLRELNGRQRREYSDAGTQQVVDDVVEWSKSFLTAHIIWCTEQINFTLGKRSAEVLAQYISNVKRLDIEVTEAKRAFHAHERSLRLHGHNNRMAALAILVSVIAIIVSIGSCSHPIG